MATFQISELAERAGVPATTLRYYEQAGLLAPARSANGYRRYGDDALDRLVLIRAGQHLGLPLAEIRPLLELRDHALCADVRAHLRPLLAAHITQARTHTASLTESIARLEQALAATDAGSPPGRCAPGCGCLTSSASLRQANQPHPPRKALLPRVSQAPQQSHQPQGRQAQPAQVAIACSLDGDDRQTRRAEWRDLLAGATAREPVTEGVRFTLPAARAGRAAELSAAEQRCCPFFRFTLVFDGADVHLTMQAAAGAGDLLAALTDELGAAVSS